MLIPGILKYTLSMEREVSLFFFFFLMGTRSFLVSELGEIDVMVSRQREEREHKFALPFSIQ